MDSAMDQNVAGLNQPANQSIGSGRRETDQWFDNRRMDIGNQYQQMQPSYYKFQNEIGELR